MCHVEITKCRWGIIAMAKSPGRILMAVPHLSGSCKPIDEYPYVLHGGSNATGEVRLVFPLPMGPTVCCLLPAHPLNVGHVARSGSVIISTSASVCVCVLTRMCIVCVSCVCNADTYTNHQ